VGALRGNSFGARRRAIRLQFLQEVQVRGAVPCVPKLHDLCMVLCHCIIN